jgi:glycosyltransferase involved in cell wall biosynthesis
MENKNIWIVIAAYNEQDSISSVVKGLLHFDDSLRIVVVDDGSSDETIKAACQFNVTVLRHPVNLGQGAALATGIEYALKNNADIIITFDADGQMDPADIPGMVRQIAENGYDAVLGSRFLGVKAENMPPAKKITLTLATILTRLTTGLKITDTHNGFRAFSSQAAAKIRIKQNRMAHASEILSEIDRNKLKYIEVPVKIRYTDYSKTKGQSVLNSINILFELFMGEKK